MKEKILVIKSKQVDENVVDRLVYYPSNGVVVRQTYDEKKKLIMKKETIVRFVYADEDLLVHLLQTVMNNVALV